MSRFVDEMKSYITDIFERFSFVTDNESIFRYMEQNMFEEPGSETADRKSHSYKGEDQVYETLGLNEEELNGMYGSCKDSIVTWFSSIPGFEGKVTFDLSIETSGTKTANNVSSIKLESITTFKPRRNKNTAAKA